MRGVKRCKGMLFRLAIAALLAELPAMAGAQNGPSLAPTQADELLLPPDHIIRVKVNGVPMRLLVTAEADGPMHVNPAVAVRLNWKAQIAGTHYVHNINDFLYLLARYRTVDIEGKKQKILVMWSTQPITDVADGVIGIHHLPYNLVTFPLGPPIGDQTVQRLPLKQFGRRFNDTVGTELDADGEKFKVFFGHRLANNLVTAPSANFLASRFGGGFIPGSDSEVAIDYDIKRPVRMMKLARPLKLGDILIDHFSVRYRDWGNTNKVAEIGPDDPPFDPNEIIVWDSKRRGRPDFYTSIGRNQIAHCSQITYDFELREIRLTCGALPK
ncbi:hypothetical protein [Porphyrobacter sp. TH134]|uniref:hypothetical protein n=1 Tax=Porphyrobacter sp. TH134 TaxID=2067450 RepID=UPI00117CACE8|nr:hypothetical protein [Porphyrobacter sp. TH134]